MSLLFCHLGESIPFYAKDCIHQVRLWNPKLPIYFILEPIHKDAKFFLDIESQYSITLVFTDSLKQTQNHKEFLEKYQGDNQFRKGYWRFVTERFYFFEETAIQYSLQDFFVMEYDVCVYTDLEVLREKLKPLGYTMRMVKCNTEKGHPAFMYFPCLSLIRDLNEFIKQTICTGLVDMNLLGFFSTIYPRKVSYFPVMPSFLNKGKRISLDKEKICDNPWYLFQDFESLLTVFDSLVIGQFIGGIDPRNTHGEKILYFLNESALYTFLELKFSWKKDSKNRWCPTVHGFPLAIIHIHSKSLSSFLSDRSTVPQGDYNIEEINSLILKCKMNN